MLADDLNPEQQPVKYQTRHGNDYNGFIICSEYIAIGKNFFIKKIMHFTGKISCFIASKSA